MNSVKHAVKQQLARLIGRLCGIANIDLLNLAHSSQGIGQASAIEKSGELNFIRNILPSLVGENPNPYMLDVGANQGDYSLALRQTFPSAHLFAFEPNVALHEAPALLSSQARVIKAGLSNTSGQLTLTTPSSGGQSLQSSFSEKVAAGFTDSETTVVPVLTLDQFLTEEGIDRVSFLKIDVEGLEMEVLEGSEKSLESNRIDLIQFEFNEVNIKVGRFLEEFYSRLPGYDLFRITLDGLHPLGKYHPKHEIFLFQNIVAIRRGLRSRHQH